MLYQEGYRLLAGKDPSLAEMVAPARTDAHANYARIQERFLDARGIEPQDIPFPDVPWLALLDGPRHRQHLEYFDWRERAISMLEGTARTKQARNPRCRAQQSRPRRRGDHQGRRRCPPAREGEEGKRSGGTYAGRLISCPFQG
jgi:hypothetical protein